MMPFEGLDASRFTPDLLTGAVLQTPALVIHMPTVRHNVERVLEAIGDPACWRPHLKTTKIPAIWQVLLDAGVDRFKCSTTHEVALLLELAPEPAWGLPPSPHGGCPCSDALGLLPLTLTHDPDPDP